MKKNTDIKICLYLEFYHFLGGFLYKNVGTGLLTSYRNQKKILTAQGISFTEKWDDSCTILQINTPWFWSLRLIKKARRQNKKVIIWSHVTAEDIKGVFRFSFLLSSLARKYLTYAYGLADIIFSPSEYTKTLLIAYGIPAEKIMVMSNGVDTETYTYDEEKRKKVRDLYGLHDVVVGTVALAIPRKGIRTFLSLAKKFPLNSFIWFGKIYSPLIAPALPKELPVNAQFTGFVDDIVGAYAALDIFIFPSYEENEGMAILEAAAIGRAIVVRDIPVYRGWLVHGENCLVARTEEEFVFHIATLVNDRSLRTKLGEGSKMLAMSRNISKVGAQVVEIYRAQGYTG